MAAVGDSLKLVRDDILDFPPETIKLILEMQKDGWRAQRSNKNHVMLLAPDGETRLGASRNPDSAKYLSEDLRRYNKAQGKEEREPVVVKRVAQKWPCPRPTCMKVFASEEKLNTHIAVDHEKMVKCPDCDDTFKTAKALGLHRARKHGYVSPRYAARKAAEAKREGKKTIEALKRTEKASRDLESRSDAKLEKADDIAKKIVAEDVVSVAVNPEDIKEAVSKLNRDVVINLDDINEKDASIFNEVFVTPGLTVPSHATIIHKGEIKSNDDIVGLSIYAEPATETLEHITFLDERDSWTLNLEDISEMTISNLRTVMKAAGLDLEIRVWKE